MDWRRITLLAFLVPLSAGAATADPCPLFSDVFQKEIKPKIESGVPFELMTQVSARDNVLCRRVVHLTYNLWDEVISLTEGEKTAVKIPMQESLSKICEHLQCEYTAANKGEKILLKVLLNPMWAGRIARLQAVLPERASSHSLVSVDWSEVAKQMPSEKELVSKEISP